MDHSRSLAKRMARLILDENTADMSFIVQGEKLPAHRAIFTVSSEYFRALLDGRMKESTLSEIVLEDVPLGGFKTLMAYVYTGQLNLRELDLETVLDVLQVANLYGFGELETGLCLHFEKNLTTDNVCPIYARAHSLQLKELAEDCCRFMMREPTKVLNSEDLWNLSELALYDLLNRDAFYVDEIELFKAFLKSPRQQLPPADNENILKAIRLPLIDTKELVTTVRDSGLFSTEHWTDAIKAREFHPLELKFRGALRNDVNLATPECGALILKARPRGSYETATTGVDYDSEDMPPFPSEITYQGTKGLTIALIKPSLVNKIKFKLFDVCWVSYYIEVSVDLVNWVRIMDLTKSWCDDVQTIYFEPRVVRYVRMVTTRTDIECQNITLSALDVTHTTESFELDQGFLVPKENVASIELGCGVFGSLSKCRALISNVASDDPKGTKWTSHEIGKRPIELILPHPFTVSSMKMQLRDDDSRAYLYHIETSIDRENWTRVADHTRDLCRSWQRIVFEARPVQFIRITGTHSTVDNIFSCARFECPAPAENSTQTPIGGNEVEEGA